MPVNNPYQLTDVDKDWLRTVAPQLNMSPEQGVAEANRLLLSGEAANMEDLRRITNAAMEDRNAKLGTQTVSSGLLTYDPTTGDEFGALPDAKIAKAKVSGYTPVSYKPTSYTAKTYQAEGYTPTERGYETYDPEQAELTEWDVTPDQLVEERIQGLLKKGSPLLTLEETKARQGMAAKGLLSSSMAEGEALRAVTESARSIAAADAATLAAQGQFNAQQANILSQFNVQQINAAEAFNADAANRALADNQMVVNSAAEFLANAKNTASSDNTRALNEAAKFAAEAANQADAAYALARNTALAFKAQAKNAASIAEAQDINAAARSARSDAVRARELAVNAENEARRFTAEAANRAAENQAILDADVELRTLERRAQVSDQATNLWQNTTDNITKIMADPELDADAKKAAVEQQKASLVTALDFLEKVNNVEGIKDLLTFTDTTGDTTGGTTGGATGVTTGGTTGPVAPEVNNQYLIDMASQYGYDATPEEAAELAAYAEANGLDPRMLLMDELRLRGLAS